MRKLIQQLISFVLVGAALGTSFYWLGQEENYAAVKITAPRDSKENTVPVYAQFVVTQLLYLEEPVKATKISLPLYLPADDLTLFFRLRRHGEEILAWQLLTKKHDEVTQVELLFDHPRLLDGNLELEISANEISHEQKDNAPLLLQETANEHYPFGNFRIAANDKEGDIALTLHASRQRAQRLWQESKENPLEGVTTAGGAILILMLIAALPGIIGRPPRHRS